MDHPFRVVFFSRSDRNPSSVHQLNFFPLVSQFYVHRIARGPRHSIHHAPLLVDKMVNKRRFTCIRFAQNRQTYCPVLIHVRPGDPRLILEQINIEILFRWRFRIWIKIAIKFALPSKDPIELIKTVPNIKFLDFCVFFMINFLLDQITLYHFGQFFVFWFPFFFQV